MLYLVEMFLNSLHVPTYIILILLLLSTFNLQLFHLFSQFH